MKEELQHYLSGLKSSLDAEVDLHGGRTEMAKNLRLAITATEKELENLGQPETIGKSHEIEPDELDDYMCAVWFDEMPDDEEEVRVFHADALANIAETLGLYLDDLRPDGSEQPDYDEVERRVHRHGYDTYSSDTRLIIFTPRAETEG
jgi:hypothetical protein